MQLAFVILDRAALPEAAALLERLPGARFEGAADSDTCALELPGGRTLTVGLMPAPIPNQEAEAAAGHSLLGLADGWKLRGQSAHLIVTATGPQGAPPLESLQRFTREVAAVAEVSGALGVYWGGGSVTHRTADFVELAASEALPLPLWIGVSFAQPRPNVVSFLSLGMQQLELMELMIEAPASDGGAALEMLYDLLLYMVERGRPIPEGETVGRSEDERLPVRWVSSPVHPGQRIMAVSWAD